MPRLDGRPPASERMHLSRHYVTEVDADHALRVAADLIRLGAPVGLARPATFPGGDWNPTGGIGNSGHWVSRDWEQIEPDPAVLRRYRRGDGLFMVTGHTFDVIDIDPRNGGDESYAELIRLGLVPKVYARAATPSGGEHLFIAATGARKTNRGGIDLQAGDAQGHGRGFVWIAPTVRRSKVDGVIRPYVWGQA